MPPKRDLRLREGEIITILRVTYCSREKKRGIQRVEDLYASNRVRKFVEACSSRGLPWAILSAKYGLLFPGSTAEPYDVTLRSAGYESCFLGVRVFIGGKRLPTEESNRYLRDLCARISSQLAKHGVEKVVLYAPNPYRAKSYIKILQSALENCRDPFTREDVLDYVKKKGQIEVVTRLEDLVKGSTASDLACR